VKNQLNNNLPLFPQKTINLHFCADFFAYVKKKQYLCTRKGVLPPPSLTDVKQVKYMRKALRCK
jgi:hypothetical protein